MISFQSSALRKKQRPRVPDGVRVYAVGDIHGRADLLEEMLNRIDADMAAKPIRQVIEIFLGDYIDRGPASRDVLDQLVARQRNNRAIFLKGNHESYITEFVGDPAILKDWQRLGGLETLVSYGLTPSINADAATQKQLASEFAKALPESHYRFLGEMKTSYTCGDFFFVHAGVRPGVPLDKQREEDLLWIRWEFLNSDDDFGKIVVHGHTPVPQPEIRPNRINIDTGAYATGQLTCIVLERDEINLL